MLACYGVFDELEFRVDGVDTVVLMGQVTRPTLESDAERTVKRIEGVGKVEKRIGVLPLSATTTCGSAPTGRSSASRDSTATP